MKIAVKLDNYIIYIIINVSIISEVYKKGQLASTLNKNSLLKFGEFLLYLPWLQIGKYFTKNVKNVKSSKALIKAHEWPGKKMNCWGQ